MECNIKEIIFKSMFRGYEIESIDGREWFFCDNGQSTVDHWMIRPCGHCKKMQTKDGHDPCIGTLKDVQNACCGHGNNDLAYIQYDDGSELRGESVFVAIKKI